MSFHFDRFKWLLTMPPSWVGRSDGRRGFPSADIYEEVDVQTRDLVIYDPLGLVATEQETSDGEGATSNGVRKGKAATISVTPYSAWLYHLKQAVAAGYLKEGQSLVEQRAAVVGEREARLDVLRTTVEAARQQVGEAREPDDVGRFSGRELLILAAAGFVAAEAATIWQGLQWSGLDMVSSIVGSLLVVTATTVVLSAMIRGVQENGWGDSMVSRVAKVAIPCLAGLGALVGFQLYRVSGLSNKFGTVADTGPGFNMEALAAFLVAIVFTTAATLTLLKAESPDLDEDHEKVKAARLLRRRLKKLRQAEEETVRQQKAISDAQVEYQDAVRATKLLLDAADMRLHLLDTDYRSGNKYGRKQSQNDEPIPETLNHSLPKTTVRIVQPAAAQQTAEAGHA